MLSFRVEESGRGIGVDLIADHEAESRDVRRGSLSLGPVEQFLEEHRERRIDAIAIDAESGITAAPCGK